MGVVTEVGLRTFLLDKLNGQLAGSIQRVDSPIGGDQGQLPLGPPTSGRLRFLGGGAGTAIVVIDNGTVTDAYTINQQNYGKPVKLPPDALAAMETVQVGKRPSTVDLGGSLGAHQVIAVASDRTPGRVLIVGLSVVDINSTLLSTGLIMLGVALIAVLLTALAGELIIRYTLTPLRRVAATASRVAELPLERGEVALSVRVADRDTNPRTEVGQVGSALNRMLGHIANALAVRHASEMRVRKFVADASHELRTPLAAIRGYAELTRRSGDKVPPDIARAMDRVESESIRMTALVEDLLLLARLDAGSGRCGGDSDRVEVRVDPDDRVVEDLFVLLARWTRTAARAAGGHRRFGDRGRHHAGFAPGVMHAARGYVSHSSGDAASDRELVHCGSSDGGWFQGSAHIAFQR